MRILRLFVAAFLAAIIGSPAFSAPLEVYGRLPFIEDVALSPDGHRIAIIVTDGEKRNIVIRSLDDGKNITGLAAGNTKIRAITWASPQILLITSTVTGDIEDILNSRAEHAITKAFEVDTGKLRGVLDNAREMALNTSIGRPIIRVVDGQPVILVKGVSFVQNSGALSLFKILPGGAPPMNIETGGENVDDFFVDDRSQAFAETTYDDHTGSWTIGVKRNGRWGSIIEGKDPHGSPTLVGYGRTPGTLLVEIDTPTGGELRELTIADGKWGATLPDEDIRGVLTDRQGRIIGGLATHGDETHYTFYNPADQATWNALLRAFPGQKVSFEGWSDDHRRLLVEISSSAGAPAYAWVDLGSGQAQLIGGVYQNLTAKDVSPVKAVKYAAADGKQIYGYLTLPAGKDKGLPLVVLPHGGPASRDTMDFDWWAQALASRGYAVLQPNFRGSTGYGEAFMESGFGEWGRKMQTDLSDGVRFLAAQGTIDPKRVCIVGASYGGYAALAGAAIDTGVYKCAASVAGISDLHRMLKSEKANAEAAFRYFKQFIGADSANDPKLDQISPLQQLAKVDIPVLLIHGKDDTVVPFEQSKVMADALKKAGKPVEFVILDGEDHWLSSGVTRLKMLQAVTAFLEKNNPPG